jgi:hypothetical protein
MDTIHLSASVVRASLGKGPARLFGLLGYIDGKRELGGVRVHNPHASSDVLARGGAGLQGYDGDRVAWVYALNAAELTKAGQYQMRGGKSVALTDETGRALLRADGTPDVRRVGSKGPALARHVDVALPHGLDTERRRALMQGMADWLRERFGCAVAWAAHSKGDGHLVVSDRAVRDDGSVGAKIRALNGPSDAGRSMEAIRAEWARRCNETGLVVWDHRSFQRRGLSYEPEKKVDRKAQKEARRRGVRGPLDEIRLNRPAVQEARARQDAARAAAHLGVGQRAQAETSSETIAGLHPPSVTGFDGVAQPLDARAQDRRQVARSTTDRTIDEARSVVSSLDAATQAADASDGRRILHQDERSAQQSSRDRDTDNKAKRHADAQDRADERAREQGDAALEDWAMRQQKEQEAQRDRDAAARRRAEAEKEAQAEAQRQLAISLAQLEAEVARRDARDEDRKRARASSLGRLSDARPRLGQDRLPDRSDRVVPVHPSPTGSAAASNEAASIRPAVMPAGERREVVSERERSEAARRELPPASVQDAPSVPRPMLAPAPEPSPIPSGSIVGTARVPGQGSTDADRPDHGTRGTIVPALQPGNVGQEHAARRADAERADRARRHKGAVARAQSEEWRVQAQRSRFDAVSERWAKLGERVRELMAAAQHETERQHQAEQRRRQDEAARKEAGHAEQAAVASPADARPSAGAWNPLRDVLEGDRELVSYLVRALLKMPTAVWYAKPLKQALGTLAEVVATWFAVDIKKADTSTRRAILGWTKVWNEDSVRRSLIERGVQPGPKIGSNKRGGPDFDR